jgi:hypothetical protein
MVRRRGGRVVENSIEKEEEILNNIKAYMQENIDKGYHKFVYNDLGYDEKCVDVINAIDHILSDYKRVLKENEIYKKNSEIMSKENLSTAEQLKVEIKENFRLKNQLDLVDAKNIEKDKIIDLMAEQLGGLAIFDIDKNETLILGDKEEVKQYFKDKVKGKE